MGNRHTALDGARAAILTVTRRRNGGTVTARAGDGSNKGSERGNGEESEFGEHG